MPASTTSPTFSRLYHLADARNMSSILRHGLMSTAELLRLASLSERDRKAFVRCHRPTGVMLANGAFVRDQKAMPPKALAPALSDDLRPEDWCELVNGFVFFVSIDESRLPIAHDRRFTSTD